MQLSRVFCVGLLLVVAAPAAAQDAGAVGLTMGYPGAVGVIWQINDRLAVRPDLTLSRGTTESTTAGTGSFEGLTLSGTSTSEGWSTGLGLSALVTLKTIDRLRLYLAPRLAWSHSSSENKTGLGGDLSGYSSSQQGPIVSASFGSQYGLHDRFAVFGELGVQYSAIESRSDFPGSRITTDTTSLGLRSAVGVAFFF